MGHAAGAHGQASTWPRHSAVGLQHGQPARATQQEFLYLDTGFVSRQGKGNACLGSAPVVSRYSFCIVTGGGLTGWWSGSRYNQLYRDRRGLAIRGIVSRYSLCIVTSRQLAEGMSRYNRLYRDNREEGWAPGCVAIQHSQGYDTASVRPAIRVEAHDTRSR